MQQRFVLPEKCGKLQAVSYVNVKPQFQQENVDGRVLLTGIYLIQVEVAVSDGDSVRSTDGILIDEIDLENNVAYFEYGLPLSHTLEGEAPVIHYEMAQIEGVILPDGALEIKATEHITRKQEQVKLPPPVERLSESVEVKATVSEPLALLQSEKTASWMHEQGAGIVEWLSLSNHYKTEKIQLNPILQQRVANYTEDEQ